MRVEDLIAAGVVEDEFEALDMFPIEELDEFAGGEPLASPRPDPACMDDLPGTQHVHRKSRLWSDD